MRIWRSVTGGEEGDRDATPLVPHLGTESRSFRVGLVLAGLSLVSAIATYLIMTNQTPIAPRNTVVLRALIVNAVLAAGMIALIGWQALGLYRAWRRKNAGARLHVRIVSLFSVIAAVPALMLAFTAMGTFNRVLDQIFTERTRSIVENALEVARSYVEEHGQVIRTEVTNMAKDIDDAADTVRRDPAQLRELVLAQAALRDLAIAYVVDGTGKVVITAVGSDGFPYAPPSSAQFERVRSGQVIVLLPRNVNTIAAVARLSKFPDSYLYVARPVSAQALQFLRETEAGVVAFNTLEQARSTIKLTFGILYAVVSLTALLSAIWIGLWFASRLVAPISRLIAAAQEVSRGNLNVSLPIVKGEGDLRRLSSTFNRMTGELKTQRDTLVSTNEQLTERRRFIEAVLSGVSAGIIGLDREGRIMLASRSAEKLLGRAEADLVDRPLAEAVPELAAAFAEQGGPGVRLRPLDQVAITVGGEERMFAVQITHEEGGSGEESSGSVLTFDDITELLSAQRTSAWADIARRIAHEIKNPLTPIQLSAERLRRKYGKAIADDRETFEKLTETIERQAGHIKTMVDEFSQFSRIPKPQIEPTDLKEVAREPFLLFRESHPEIDFAFNAPDGKLPVSCDRRLISQTLTNLVKNASEAIQAAAEAPDRPQGYRGRIEMNIKPAPDRIVIEVVDNGVGLPKQNRSRLLEPYVTTRAKGTGLGLAIVQKIVEQHGGTLALEDAPPAPGRARGALIRITLPADPAAAKAPGSASNQPGTAAVRAAPEPLHRAEELKHGV